MTVRESAAAHARASTRAPRFGYNPQLDGVRAFAVGLVIVGHASQLRARGAAAGVEMFFVLSGFLITTLLLQEHRLTRSIRMGAFYLRRARRLVPALIACIVFASVLYDFAQPSSRGAYGWAVVGALLYANNWLIAEHVIHVSSLLGHTWSLAEEEQYYFLWPSLLWIALRRGVSLKQILVVTGIITAGFAVVRPLVFVVDGKSDRVVYGSDMRAFGLMLGSTLAVAYAVGSREQIERIAARTFPALGAVIVTLVVWWHVYDHTGTGIVFGNTIVDIAAALLIAHLLAMPEGRIGRLFGWKPVVWIGQRSYGMYLFHYPILAVFANYSLGLAWPEVAVVAGVATAGIAAVSYRVVEQPARGRGRRPVTAPSSAPVGST